MTSRTGFSRVSAVFFLVAVSVGSTGTVSALASEMPRDIARVEDPADLNANRDVDPWGNVPQGPTIDEPDRKAPSATHGPDPIPIQPVQDRLVGKLVHWVLLQDRDLEQPFEELTAFINANRDWPRMTSLRRKAERAIDDSTSKPAILDWFDQHSPLTLEGSNAWSRALFSAGQDRTAIDNVRRTWAGFDMSRNEERQFVREFGQYLESEDHIARLDRLLWDNRRTAASRHLERLGEGRRALADARLRLMRQRGGVDAAIERVPSWLENDPGLVYERVRWRRRKDMNEGAAELLLGYRGEMVRPDRWWTERQILARRFLRDGKPALAYRLVKSHGLTDRVDQSEAEFLAGWIALRFLKDPHAAFGHFSALYDIVNYSISRARGAYWTGRAAEAAGEPKIADQWYRTAAAHSTTFYGQLAADRLGVNLAPPTTHDTDVDAREAEAFERDDLVRLVRLLVGLKATRAPETVPSARADPRTLPMAFLADLDDDKVLSPFLRHIAWRSRTTTEWVKTAKLARDAGRMEIAV